MWNLNTQITPTLLLLFLLCEYCPAGAQNAPQPDLFTPVENVKLVETSPEQSHRLQRLRDLPTTQSIQVLRINRAPIIGDKLKIPISNNKIIDLAKTGVETHDSKNFTWLGVVQGEQRSNATLVIRNGEITGSINSVGGLYRISPLGDGLYAIVKVDTGKLPPDEPPSKDPPTQR